MATITNTLEVDSYWSDSFWDQLLDIDQLSTSSSGLISNNTDDQNRMSIEEEYEETSSLSEIDPDQTHVSSLPDNAPTQTLVANLVCGVCGAPAYGYNFDQITCESCKAFFRRNALRQISDLKCRSNRSCVINIRTRRQCTYCRLKKCFDINMRKDWIRTDEEKELRQLQKLIKEQNKLNKLTNNREPLPNLPIVVRKKKRLMIRPTIQDLIVQPIHSAVFFSVNRHLSDDDRIQLNNITNAYQVAHDQACMVRKRQGMLPSSLIEFINAETEIHESLINYYKSVPEFKDLNLKDQILLIKSNLVKIIHVHCILIDKFEENSSIGPCMTKWISEDFHQGMTRARLYFNRFIEHPLILKLALIVFIFSINLSTPYCTDLSDDYSNKTNICAIQDFYTTILWRYLTSIYDEREAIRSMNIITSQILHFQTLTNIIEDVISHEPDRDACNQLESSLFRLTF